MKHKKASITLFLMTLMVCALLMSGCVYSHNYDENGNEMNREQVEEAVDDIRESIENEINNAISADE
ncbi:UNVERIFIED_ORG: hypothetical protein B5F06_15200 [Lacrimispora saccharolytica]|uniref:Secreted protein n=1 Tax=Anaerotruncus colihominis TaxID=169435 RepID=A0A1Y4MRJ0_9FIRM|nr:MULTISPECIES: hypothetical protein [Eubacteriales]MBS5389223.1 hypothetical protein [Clostridiales bacterium]OUP67477.1 hypothetical protein B5F11_18240 [Anaerotruncus colihominis]OUP71298.1 hypothetical protein B5F10_18075 [Anaerotruncus colihominis]RHT55111.1 hypothetical protein DW757_16305 [Clostridium sp. AM29-11AC]